MTIHNLMMARQHHRRGIKIRRRAIRVYLKVQARLPDMSGAVVDHQLVTQRKPLEHVVPYRWERWLVRKYFEWRGFACRSHVCENEDGRHGNGKTVNCPNCGSSVAILCDGKCYASIEYRGTFEDESAARWAANCEGGAVKPIPFEAALPEETVTYRAEDIPQSREASQFYREGVRLPFLALRREEIDGHLADLAVIEQRLARVSDCIEGTCARAV